MDRLVAIIGLVFLLAGCERPSQSFDDYAELDKRDAFQSGWIPTWLPKSSRRIEERHDIDMNASILSASFDDEYWIEQVPCQPAESAAPARLKADWWPDPATLTPANGWELFACMKKDFLLINRREGRLLHWSLG